MCECGEPLAAVDAVISESLRMPVICRECRAVYFELHETEDEEC